MDRNTVIGFVLIGLVLFLFTWLNRPNPEQVEAQRRYNEYMDSLKRVEQVQQQAIDAPTNESAPGSAVLSTMTDSVKTELLIQNFGDFAQAAEGVEELITLENDKIELKISNKGGRLAYARLKEYKTWDGKPLVLFNVEESSFTITFILATNRVVSTSDLYFTPIQEGLDANSVVMRLSIDEGRYIDFRYLLSSDDYMLKFDIQSVGLNGVLSPNTNTLDINWKQKARKLEKGRKFENQFTGMQYNS
jgi:YidC/Oxa1 family membrane protein insertase